MSNIRQLVLVMQRGGGKGSWFCVQKHTSRSFSKALPNIPSSLVVFQTKDLNVCGGLLADLDPQLWSLVTALISVVFVRRAGVIRANTPSTYFTNAPAYDETCMGDMSRGLKDLRVGKPVIYLNSPTNIDILVAMSLVPEWQFSAIYPVIPIKNSSLGEHIEWNVRTHSHDGTLTDKYGIERGLFILGGTVHLVNGLNASCPSISTDSNLPSSPPRSPILGELAPEHFNPGSPDLCDSNSVVLAVKDITLYLDKTKTWGPWHNHVALRFVPQAAYENAAPLVIKPEPDIVTRIFMLFKGVMQESLGDWRQATIKALEDVSHWRDVVGVDLDLALDTVTTVQGAGMGRDGSAGTMITSVILMLLQVVMVDLTTFY
ncbi:hypothetical protein SERLA73DRAFT_149900 [Serpula lacrymans var. lacrymans S7.3]|uniref:Uncharacterized protein n=1 Tax=Serpula lacrymans var. lacrymans (strain S7.3) TaxID=936435 RepID=F8PIQ2_SERL3|nr:hypothetical protein SERLA73DRAFT_149900 [Serpula lacrymans var. lacrymans S7.3]